MKATILILGMVWPEPESTAAGTRMLQLVQYFRLRNFRIVFASTASKTENSFPLAGLGVECREIFLNDSGFDAFIDKLQPGIVLFDRFVTEEQFGWRVREACPEAIRILDTEDLHSVRYSRELALKNGNPDFRDFLNNDISFRELASIYRSDLSLIISEWELDFLIRHFHVPTALLLYLPFLPGPLEEESYQNSPSFEERHGFMTMGNLKHGPNLDAVFYLFKEIWPRITKRMPKAEMFVYGAYTPNDLAAQFSSKGSFRIMGRAKHKKDAYSKHRVCLAPLRYGAGLKGKLIDAMRFGTPSVTTAIGAEGINGELAWSGQIGDDPDSFASEAVAMYSNKELWDQARDRGRLILEQRFDRDTFYLRLTQCLEKLTGASQEHRQHNFYGNMLWHHSLLSTRYLSKWIEAKNQISSQRNNTATVPIRKEEAVPPEGSAARET